MKTSLLYIVLAFACFPLLPNVLAVSPAPDGCYGQYTTAEGCNALNSLTTGVANTGIGWYSLFSNTGGNYSTGVGAGALALNNADSNTAVGTVALFLNSSGTQNTAAGTAALLYNDTGNYNTAVGYTALQSNTSGSDNTAIGSAALQTNTIGDQNTAVGSAALITSTGSYNTAVGFTAMFLNTTGSPNSAFGWGTLKANTTGNYNTAIGYAALFSNSNGNDNTALGDGALYSNTSGSYNIAIGVDAGYNMTGSDNIALGNFAGVNVTSETDNIEIGNAGVAGDFQTIRIGTENFHFDTFIAGIHTPVTGTPVVVNGDGQLGVAPSSERFKDDITPMDKVSNVILALKPVCFRYKKKIDPRRTPQFGLVAEEVAKVNPALVLPDKEGKPYTVRYDAVNAMLLNEFLKEHRKVEKLEALVTKQHKDFEAALTDLKREIQRVSAQLELSKASPQTVLNDQ